tara:strand:+ start:684 stop:1163 length:480 start_codon:yes stop_codon:yes gene_type:complete
MGDTMKKIFIGIILALIATNGYALSYGLFKLEVETGYFDAESVTFLLNSSGEVKLLKNENYYSIETESFFDELTLFVRSGGDEDWVQAIFTLKNNELTRGCSALLDGPGSTISFLSPKRVQLTRWNKERKKFEVLKNAMSDQKSCYATLKEDFEDFSEY